MRQRERKAKMKKNRWTWLGLILVLAGCSQLATKPTPTALSPAGTPPATPLVPQFAPAACPFTLPPGITEGKDVVCGYVTVPEEHAQPAGATLRLAVVIIKSTSVAPAPDPLVMAAGGPGASIVVSAPALLAVTDPDLRGQRDIVLIEQRGVRYSEPFLFCPELQTLARAWVSRPLPAAERAARRAETVAACRERLTAEGINLAAYNSLESAADIPWVVSALGYDRFNFYGISYATLLAQHLMRDYPERLRSVILDAPVPLGVDYAAAAPANTQRAFRRFFEYCAADPACAVAYPDLEKRFFELVEELKAHPRIVHFESPAVEAVVTGDTLVWMLYQHLYYATLPMLPAWLAAFADQRGDDLITALGPELLLSMPTNGMSFSVRCADEAAQLGAEPDLTGVHPQVAATLREAFSIQADCQVWAVPPLPETALQPVASEIPTLILSGEFDPVTPATNAELLAQRLRHSFAYTLPGRGHGTFLKHRCPTLMVLDFLRDPTHAPVSDCLADMSVQFVIPTANLQLAPFADKTFGLQGMLPVGWAEVQPGIYLYVDTQQRATLLEVVRLPDQPLEEQIASWLPTYGITEFPAPSGTRETAAFTWDLYSFTGQIAGLGTAQAAIAIAQTETGVYLVGLYAPPATAADLREQVFLPVVDALARLP